eukprot:CAMPEP_0174248274 /NCGR_PEP_ID=MMETSP0417-20130205/42995_1 /TAXON_ID=242541 /ORGANISM="Mayorella sp, Strain BSH-02190019" /LENGTH=139 /DNA_ID=CAMNT_0015328137 /DNA_START=631 /DNA_END=1047 /DNA_ORIENTATION=-
MMRLLEHGCHVNAADTRGLTALHHAVIHDDPISVALLLHGGANAYSKTKRGQRALDLVNYELEKLCSRSAEELDRRTAERNALRVKRRTEQARNERRKREALAASISAQRRLMAEVAGSGNTTSTGGRALTAAAAAAAT